MNLDKIIEEKFKQNRIFGVNKPSILKEMLNIPEYVDIKKLDSFIDSYYETFYIQKKWATSKPTKEERYEKFLCIEKEKQTRLKEIPEGEDRTHYRKIVSINSIWLKKTQKRINRLLMDTVLTNKERGKKRESIIPYLHSSVKQRSYNTNAKVHVGNKYVLALDLKDFYPSVTKMKLYKFFKNKYNLSSDTAMIYAILSTTKADDGSYRLGQGLAQSATLAFLSNYQLFNYLYEYGMNMGIEMSIYVDDIVFSSNKQISQEFIDKMFGIIKSNGMEIKREKIHNYKKESVKKITGVYINGHKTRVSNQKHEEIEIQYQKLKNDIMKISTIEDYFKVYNLYLKFYGNYQHINMVENKVNGRYTSLIDDYDDFFPKGINKKQKSINYRKGNIRNITDSEKINKYFQQLKNKLFTYKSKNG